VSLSTQSRHSGCPTAALLCHAAAMQFHGNPMTLRPSEVDSAPAINFVNFASFVDLGVTPR
jgi:hypothetical protein